MLQEWKRAENYMGQDYFGHYVVLSRNRNSELLKQSNFDSALKMLGGEGDGVLIVRNGHWMVGWIELLLVDKTNKDKVAIAEKIDDLLYDYPILDEDDFSQREHEAYSEDTERVMADEDLLNKVIAELGITNYDDKFKALVENPLRERVYDKISESGGEWHFHGDRDIYEFANDIKQSLMGNRIEIIGGLLSDMSNQMEFNIA